MMSKEIEFSDVIDYLNDMGSDNHLAMFLPEERHEEFIVLQSAFDQALGRFKETVKKWADESYEQTQIIEEIQLLLKRGVTSPAHFLQEVQQLTKTRNRVVEK